MATAKERVLELLSSGEPMLSMDMAEILGVTKATASTATKELHEAGFIHISEWRLNKKNGGNKVYAIGQGVDAVNPTHRSRSEIVNKGPFTPHPDIAAAWMMTK